MAKFTLALVERLAAAARGRLSPPPKSIASFLSPDGQFRVVPFLKPQDDLVGDFLHFLFRVFSADGAFPDGAEPPAAVLVDFPDFLIAPAVPGELFLPESDVGSGHPEIRAVPVCMPEAAVYEDDRIVFGEDEVRAAGIAAVTHPEAESCPVEGGTDILLY